MLYFYFLKKKEEIGWKIKEWKMRKRDGKGWKDQVTLIFMIH